MIRFRKKYISKPSRDSSILVLESSIIKTYGLKNKKEIYKARGLVQKYLRLNRTLDKDSITYRQAFTKLVKLGVLAENFISSDIHSLSVDNFLKRRLQTLVANIKGVTLFQARQLITHGKIKVNGVIKRYPSYLIRLDSKITFK